MRKNKSLTGIKKRRPAAVLAALLMAAAVVSGSILLPDIYVAAENVQTEEKEPLYPEKEHTHLDYSELAYEGYDETQLKAALSELEELCGEDNALSVDRVIELYHQVEKEFDILQTQMVLCEIRTKMDVTDEEMQKAQLELSNKASILSDEAGRVLKMVLDSQFRDELVYEIGEQAAAVLDDYTPLEQWYLDLSDRETVLVQKYYQLLDEDDPVTINGEEWTFERFDEEPPEDEAESEAVRQILYRSVNDKVMPILQELIQVRNELAVKSGYDNYAEYAYDVVFGRDYDKDEVEKLYTETKKKIVPLQNRLSVYGYYRGYEEKLDEYTAPEQEELLDLVEPQIESVDERLLESFDYLREHHDYDIEKRPGKAASGFTVPLAQYGTAFIFINPTGTIEDIHTLIHEFGHYNVAFHSLEPAIVTMSNVDVAEIQSQALELLTAEKAEELLGDCGKAYRADRVTSMLSNAIEGCYFDEFQWKLYENPEMTPEEINRLALQIGQEYGFYFPKGAEGYYAWVLVQHTFEQPMYYISYTVSALSALDIAARAETDRESAVDLYMHLTAIDPNLPYREAVSQLGLTDIFEDGGIAAICAPLTDMLGYGSTNQEENGPERLSPIAQRLLEKRVLYGIVACTALLLIIGISLNVVRRRRLLAARAEAARLAEEQAQAALAAAEAAQAAEAVQTAEAGQGTAVQMPMTAQSAEPGEQEEEHETIQ